MAGDQQQRVGVGPRARRPQQGNVGGIVLAVAVERRDPGAARRLDAGADRRALAVAGAMADQPQPGEAAGEAGDLGGGRVGAAVVDIDDLIVERAIQRGADLGDERRDILGLVAHGNDDRKIHENAA